MFLRVLTSSFLLSSLVYHSSCICLYALQHKASKFVMNNYKENECPFSAIKFWFEAIFYCCWKTPQYL